MINLIAQIDNIISQKPEPRMFIGFNGYYKEAEDEVRVEHPYMESLNQEAFKDAVYKRYREKIWSPGENTEIKEGATIAGSMD